LSNDGAYCCQAMVPTVAKRWYLLLSNDGKYSCQTMVSTVVKRWYLLLSSDGTYSCQTMVPIVVKRWYLLLSNDGTYCCQTHVIGKETIIENLMFSCHWNTFVGQYVLYIWTTKLGPYIIQAMNLTSHVLWIWFSAVKGPVQPCVTTWHETSFSFCSYRIYC